MRSLATLVIGAAVASAAACGTRAGVPDAGFVPQLSDCFVGEFFAECPGDARPAVLACDDAECLWFPRGTPAAGFTASTCPADSICCHGNWPFDPVAPSPLYSKLYGLGLRPWDRIRAMAVDVVEEPTLAVSASGATCDGPDPFSGTTPCNDPTWADSHNEGAVRGAVVLHLGTRRGVAGWHALVEIDPTAAPTTKVARVCAYRTTDAIRSDCPAGDVLCATAGTLTVTRVPKLPAELAGLMGTIDATFAQGLVLHLELRLPP
ncbi:MAG TPA: hypothetical protein VKE22_08150 [Haliangiales bacterium]|nr:hypothetical protein [Haliangiales bacterium]